MLEETKMEKIKLFVSESMPQLTKETISKQEIEDVIDDISHHYEKATVVENYPTKVDGWELKKIQLNTVTYFFAESPAHEVVYFVRIRKVENSLLPRPANRQVLVWRKKTGEVMSFLNGIAKWVFWNFVFGQHQCAVSDTVQTEEGARFWTYIVQDALEKHNRVRVINTNDNTFKDYSSYSQFVKDDGKIWGTAEWFTRMVIAVYK